MAKRRKSFRRIKKSVKKRLKELEEELGFSGSFKFSKKRIVTATEIIINNRSGVCKTYHVGDVIDG